MKLVDFDQTIFVPVVDETHGGVTVEMKMTVGEFFGKFCQGFEPEVMDAIPMWWITEKYLDVFNKDKELSKAVWLVRKAWIEGQEAR